MPRADAADAVRELLTRFPFVPAGEGHRFAGDAADAILAASSPGGTSPRERRRRRRSSSRSRWSGCRGDPPLDHKRRPRLALARADRDEVYLHAGHNSDVYRFDARGGSWHWGGRHAPSQDRSIRRGSPDSWESGYACVPTVPANVRPRRGQLRSFYILWEVDRWADRSRHAPPPVVPFLLKRLGGTLYPEMAAWDLTEIERAIMAEVWRT